jgi:hypothetical protein
LADAGAARGRLQVVIRLLSSVVGRHPDLDQALRSFGGSGILADAHAELDRWRAMVQAALQVVG